VGWAWPDKARVRHAQQGQRWPGSGAARPGRHRPGQGVAGAAARRDLVAAAVRVEAMREREKRKKERVDPGTIPAYVRRDDTSADDHKWIDLRGGRDVLYSSATR
jgi:hypothetical protein